jgi:heme A synthase
MIWQVRSGAWNAPDPAEAIAYISRTAGGAIGIVTVVLLVAFVVHRRRGN